MKFSICITLSALLFASAAGFSQITLGAAGNIITSNFTEDYDNLKTRLSVSLGAAGAYDITEKVSVGAEMLFALAGPRLDDPDDGTKGRISLNLLQIPLFVNYEIIEGLKAHIGFQPGILLSAKTHATAGPYEGDYDDSEDYGTLDMAFILGASYDITGDWTAIFRLNQSLGDLETGSDDEAALTGIVLGARYWLWRN